MQQIRHFEAIIRLVKYQLDEVLPLALEAAGPPQSDDTIDTTNLVLEAPRQVKNTYRAVEINKFPATIISPINSGPVNREDLLDQNARDCVAFRHDFAVHVVLASAESQVEDSTYVLIRYVQTLIDTVCGFTEQALIDACAAAQLSPSMLVEIVPGEIEYSEEPQKSILLRHAIIPFTAFS